MVNYLSLIAVIITAFFGGGSSPMVKLGVGILSPLLFTFFRYVVAVISTLPLLNKHNYQLTTIKTTFLVNLLLFLNIMLFAFGIRLTVANIGQMIYLTTPIIVCLLSSLILKEKLTLRKILGISIGFIGTLFLLITKIPNNYSFSQSIIGNSMIFLGAIFYSFYMIYSKKIQKKVGVIAITFNSNIISMIILMIVCLPQLLTFNYQQLNNLNTLGPIIYVGVFSTTGYLLLSQYAIKHSSSLLSSMSLYLQPVFTIIWSYFLFGDMIGVSFIASSILVFLGAFLVSY